MSKAPGTLGWRSLYRSLWVESGAWEQYGVEKGPRGSQHWIWPQSAPDSGEPFWWSREKPYNKHTIRNGRSILLLYPSTMLTCFIPLSFLAPWIRARHSNPILLLGDGLLYTSRATCSPLRPSPGQLPLGNCLKSNQGDFGPVFSYRAINAEWANFPSAWSSLPWKIAPAENHSLHPCRSLQSFPENPHSDYLGCTAQDFSLWNAFAYFIYL